MRADQGPEEEAQPTDMQGERGWKCLLSEGDAWAG